MQRRGSSGQPVKGQSANRPKARNAPAAQVSTADLQEQLDRAKRERDEALEQLAATSEVLHIIGSSFGELKLVFRTMLEKATTLCEATFGNMYLRKGDVFELAATYNSPPALVEERARAPYILKAGSPPDRMVRTKSVVHIVDLASSEFYLSREPRAVAGVELGGVRTLLLVPMLKDNEVVGYFAIFRQEVKPFTERQVELVKNFAAQAVIAIENTRLLSELRESLQQQTATADVLKVISSSAGKLEPIFNALLENAVRVCEAKFGLLYLSEGDGFRTVAMHDVPSVFAEKRRREPFFLPAPGGPMGQIVGTRRVAHITDITTVQGYTEGNQQLMDLTELGGARTMVGVPMLKDNELIGAILIYRQEVMPFSDKQIELLTSFAAQAVIAIENARLLNELRESLQQQTATADVLKVISSSPGDLAPVFKAMLENAVHICEAKFGHMFLAEAEGFRVVALESGTLPYPDWLREGSKLELRENPRGPLAQIAATKKIVHIGDLTTEAPYVERNPRMVALVKSSGARTFLGVPMFKGETLLGAIGIYRQEVRPFTDKQIDLVKNFAAQAVIAIENARLLTELRTNLSNSRPRPLTCSKSLAARHSICRWCCKR